MNKLLPYIIFAGLAISSPAFAKSANKSEMLSRTIVQIPEGSRTIKSENYQLVPAYMVDTILNKSISAIGGRKYDRNYFNCVHMADIVINTFKTELSKINPKATVAVGYVRVDLANSAETHRVVLIVTDHHTLTYDPQTKQVMNIYDFRKLYNIIYTNI